MKPFFKEINFEKGLYSDYDEKIVRRLSDIQPYVENKKALEERKSDRDSVVYEVLQIDIPDQAGHIKNSITIIKPGVIGEEYFFTKGHYHGNQESAEIYLGLKGQGVLLMQKGDREELIEMEKGTMSYIPPQWAHRTINVGQNDFVFTSFYPGDAGYDYQEIISGGFKTRICETDSENNGPAYKKVRR
ncbi:MAG: glucose-6-phosphate isomerase family protein [bacterium]